VPFSLMAFVLGQILLPVVMAAQTPHTIANARLFMTTVPVVLATELVAGYVLGNKHFVMFNAMRTVTPLVVAIAYVVAWTLGDLSVPVAVWAFASVQLLAIVTSLAACVRWHGIAAPDWGLAKRTLWYGVRAHSTNISSLLTARLDLLIMPAFLSAANVGLYSVATNVSWTVYALAGSIAFIILPIAASAGGQGPAAIIRALHGTTLVAVALAGAIALVGGVAVRLVYGHVFDGSVVSLRLLLPGSVLYAMASVLVSGLYAAHRPFLAASTQALGLAATVIGLLLFLRGGGIEAASIVSTVSYSLVFITAAITYRSVAGLAWRDYFSTQRSAVGR
jgi:O-antigen/teichoic acid export membrane protein